MKMLWVLPVVMMCGMAWGDSIDDAAAKARGVPVAQIQVENELAKAQARIADLEKRVAALQAELAKAKQPPVAKVATPTVPPVQELAIGMTFEQVQKSAFGPMFLVSESGTTKHYRWQMDLKNATGTDTHVYLIEGDFTGGKLARYDKN